MGFRALSLAVRKSFYSAVMGGGTIIGGLIAFSLFKKVAAYGVARYYGFPKIYRKLARLNRLTASSSEHAKVINSNIKTVFRLPNRVAARVSAFIRGAPRNVESQANPKNL